MAKVVDDNKNRNILSVDGLLRFQYQKSNESFLVPYLFAGVGIVSEMSSENDTQVPLGGGLNFRIGRNAYINLQAEYRSSQLDNRNNVQYGAGLVYQFGSPDRDRDGIANNQDKCPDVPGVASGNGCPDADGDGIVDLWDRCPNVAGLQDLGGCPDRDRDGIADANDPCPNSPGTVSGCPDGDSDGVADNDDECPRVAGLVSLKGCPDKDGDGVKDDDDECPSTAGLAAHNGCPQAGMSGADRDGDGVLDGIDACPDEAGSLGTLGCPDSDGDGTADAEDRCPDLEGPYSGCPDTDGDGLMDADDKCPETPGEISNSGCPGIAGEVQEVLDLAMGSVQFHSSRATLLKTSFQVLDQIVEILNEYPDYNMSINGHTDSVGDADANQLLSEKRAMTCYEYLISKGIDPLRLTANGYGESQPISDNSSSLGRLMNRRVEFNMYIQ
jgi:outer membrane protein OmpA-like peptidoglycan-associated protein